jgi:hypothetical protein
MELNRPFLKKLRLFSLMLLGLILIIFANVDTLTAAIGSENAFLVSIFLYAMGLYFGWISIELATQLDRHINRWLEGFILFLYMGFFTALWIWSMGTSLPAKVFNWLVGIVLIVAVGVSVIKRKW